MFISILYIVFYTFLVYVHFKSYYNIYKSYYNIYMLKKYKPSIDDKHKMEEDDELGIQLISNTDEPAIEVVGVAFNKHKKLSFTDDKKYRIAAPVMIPKSIYRNDKEEYYMEFTPEIIEELSKDFMLRIQTVGNGVFNYKHTDRILDSYILEAFIIDSVPKLEMVKAEYNLDMPLGTFFVVQQFNDKQEYEEVVKSGAIGFSIEGFLGLELVKDKSEFEKIKNQKFVNKIKINKTKMKKNKKYFGFKKVTLSRRQLLEAITDGEEVTKEESEVLVIIEEGKDLEVDAKVIVIEDVEKGAEEDFTGEIVIEDEDVVIEDGVITEIKEEAKEEEEEDVEVTVEETEMEDKDEDKEKKEELEDEKDTIKLAEIYDILAELKVAIEELKEVKEEVEETDKIDEVMMKSDKSKSALLSYFNSMA